jgi:hypothetical protein
MKHLTRSTPRRPVRWLPLGLSALPVLVAAAWLLTSGAPPVSPVLPVSAEHARGAALWSGAQPLDGRIAGHAQPLPASAARCLNCHGVTATAADPARDSTAPPLTARHLLQPQPRRGGPASRYDAAAFCTLLRTGTDPAAVLLPRQMPRYTIAEVDCRALWTFLVTEAA